MVILNDIGKFIYELIESKILEKVLFVFFIRIILFSCIIYEY